MNPIEISAFLTAVSHAINAGKALIDARDQIKRTDAQLEFNRALVELQEKHLSLIQGYQTLLATNESLKQELANNEKWEQERTNYKLENVGNGATVYCLDPEKASGQPLHWLCPNCFEDRKKSMLQRTVKPGVLGLFKCNRCKSEVIAQWEHPSPKREQPMARIKPVPIVPPGPPPGPRPK